MKTLRTAHRGKDRVGGMRYAVRRNNGDPACWRPAWGGVRLCGNDWWSRVIFDICAASLRMTRGLQGRETKNKMPYQLER